MKLTIISDAYVIRLVPFTMLTFAYNYVIYSYEAQR